MGVDEQETVEVVGARMIATGQLFGVKPTRCTPH